jgi:polyhydroxybutyrate depolymerase
MVRARGVVALTGLLVVVPACNSDESVGSIATSPTAVSEPAVAPTVPITSAPLTTSAPSTTPAPATQPTPTDPPPTCPSLTAGVNEVTLSAGGAEHAVRVFVPTAYAGRPLPVVLDWHGLGSNGTEQAMFSGYEAVAEAEGFLVVHPTGVPDDPAGPNSWQLVPVVEGERDDLAFADALIDDLIANWCADPARVYSTGMSNGGFFTARLVCELADRIAAAVSVAGLFHPDSCAPARPVPYTAFHGTDDEAVPFHGGGGSVPRPPDSPEWYRLFGEQVIPEEFAQFAAAASCATAATTTEIGTDVLEHEYTGCAGGTPITFFEIVGGGHTWPGSPMAEQVRNWLGYTTDTVDATTDGWAFMSQHTLP